MTIVTESCDNHYCRICNSTLWHWLFLRNLCLFALQTYGAYSYFHTWTRRHKATQRQRQSWISNCPRAGVAPLWVNYSIRRGVKSCCPLLSHFEYTPFPRRLFLAIMFKYNVTHKTGSSWRIATPPNEDRAMTTGNTHEKFSKDWTCSSGDMLADRNTQRRTHRQTYTSRHSILPEGSDGTK